MMSVSEVSRRFGDVVAVNAISFEVGPGEVVGLLGHNGAGKTTIIRMLAGLLAPDEGEIRLWGLDPTRDGDEVRRRLGVLPSTPLVDLRLTGVENLRFAGKVAGLDDEVVVERIERLLAQFGLTDRADDLVATYSAGMKQRLSLARVLLPEPQALLLDEPTSAMDPVGARDFRTMLVERVAGDGRPIILCTHDLSEAAQLCDDVMILANGEVIARGRPSDLVRSLGVSTIFRVERNDNATEKAAALVAEVDPTATVVEPGLIKASHIEEAAVPGLVRRLVDTRIDLFGLERETASLEDLYLDLHSDIDGRGGEW